MGDFLSPALAIVLVLGLLAGALWWLRRRGVASFPAAKRMTVIERVPLGAQHALHLVRVGERLVLITTGPGCCQMMDSPSRETAG